MHFSIADVKMSHWKQAVFIPQHENNQLDNIRYLQKQTNKQKNVSTGLPWKKEKKYTQEHKKRKLRRL